MPSPQIHSRARFGGHFFVRAPAFGQVAQLQELPLIAEKTSAVAAYGGGGAAVISGAAKFLGLTPGEWQVIGVLGGLVIGAIGLAFNIWLGWRRDQREAKR